MRMISLADSIDTSPEAAWAVIGDFSGIRKWAGAVEAESTEVTAEGKVRTLTMPGGRTVKELCVDEGPRHYTYSLARQDMKVYRSTVAVSEHRGQAYIQLTVEFDPAEGVEMTPATEGFLKFLGGNLKAMKRAISAA